MSKKFKAGIFLLLGILIFIIVLAGCEQLSVEGNNYVSTRFSTDVVEGENRLVTERDELLAFVNQEQTDLNKLAKYDDDFFKSNLLVIFKIVEPSSDSKSEIKSYTIENGTITINVETTRSGTDDVSTHYYFILELTKNEGNGITEIKVMKNNKLLVNKVSEEEYNNFVAQFDLSEEKVLIGEISADAEFTNDVILIVMKKTSTYPEFRAEYLGLDEVIGFRYIMQFPSKDRDEDYKSRFRQIIAIDLIPQEREKIIELIKEIEKLDFVRSAEPNIIVHLLTNSSNFELKQ